MTTTDDFAPDPAERTSCLTADELQAAQVLHQRAPYVLRQVSHSIFSIARHYGGLTYNGCSYTYMGAEHDECIRDDVLKLVAKLRKLATKQREVVAKQEQMDL